jgi:hypothetical protein
LHAKGRRQALDADLMAAITNFDPSAGANLQGLKDNAPEFEKMFLSPIGIKEPGMIGVMEPVLGS